MGWTPEQMRQTSMPDFAAAVQAWNAAQSGETDDRPSDLAGKARVIFAKRGLL